MKLTRTTEHAASSYGQPVWVDEDGQAYGEGDILLLRAAGAVDLGQDVEGDESAGDDG